MRPEGLRVFAGQGGQDTGPGASPHAGAPGGSGDEREDRSRGAEAPAVSVVIPLFDKAGEIGRALRSVRNQTRRDIEIIVVDDGSSDDGPDRVEAEAQGEARLRVVRQVHGGVSAARNRGIAAARAAWVAFLDADDEWLPGFLSSMLRLRERFPSCEVFAASYYLRPPGGERQPAILRGVGAVRDGCVLDDYFRVASISDPPVCSSAVMVSKRALAAIGGFPEGIDSGEDLLTWARLMVRFRCGYAPEPLAVFHLRESVRGTPTRTQRGDDPVGRELAALVRSVETHRRKWVKRYVGAWHKMRASVFLRSGRPVLAAREVLRGLRWAPTAGRLYAYLALAAVPGTLRDALFRSSWGRQ